MRLHLVTITGVLLGSTWGCSFFNVAGNCVWLGESPSCGRIEDDIRNITAFNLHDQDPTLGYLMSWSVGDNLGQQICQLERAVYPYIGNCCGDFGKGCVTGYKRLWCKTWPGAPRPARPKTPAPSLPVCHGPDKQSRSQTNDFHTGSE